MFQRVGSIINYGLIGLVLQSELIMLKYLIQSKSLQKTLHLSEEKIRIDGTKCVAGMERGGAGKGMMLTQVRSQE